MSTSQPSPILIRTVSSPSFSSFPRSGTLISPSANCRITGCPIQVLNPLSILDPSELQPDGNKNRAQRRGLQWYREGTGLVRTYCSTLFREILSVSIEVHPYCFCRTCGPLAEQGELVILPSCRYMIIRSGNPCQGGPQPVARAYGWPSAEVAHA